MKRFLRLLGSNKARFLVTLTVGILYSAVCIVVPHISGELVNTVVSGSGGMNLPILLTYLLFCMLQTLFYVLDDHLGAYFQIHQKRLMRKKAVEAFTLKTTAGRDEISACSSFINNDIPTITEQYFTGTIDIAKCLCLIVLSSVSLFRIDWAFTLIILGISILILLIPKALKGKKSSLRAQLSKALAQYNTGLGSVLNGIRLLHAYLYRKRANERLEKANDCVAQWEKKIANQAEGIYWATGFLQILKSALILVVGVYLISVRRIEVGGLVVVLQLAELIGAPIEVLSSLIHWRRESAPLIAKYEEMTQVSHGTAPTPELPIPPHGNMEIRNLSYEIKGVPILRNVSMTLEYGKKYMITGPSGSGKSTLLRLLSRIGEQGYSGSIAYGGAEISAWSREQWGSVVCTVFQEPYLFYEDLKENILLGRRVPQEKLDDVIGKLNLSYLFQRYQDERITPEIVENLSGGEKQRIALARAMVGAPSIYLLDEITSALDRENAAKIEQILLQEQATVVHVCHKPDPSALQKYDGHYTLVAGTMQAAGS